MSERITRKDLDNALESHKRALEACGITYTGELRVDIGSKTYGNAYRIYRVWVPTGRPVAPGEMVQCGEHRFTVQDEYMPGMWNVRNHRGSAVKPTEELTVVSSGHYNPPVGSDYLGMTAREAYDNLTTRTRVLWDVAQHMRDEGDAS